MIFFLIAAISCGRSSLQCDEGSGSQDFGCNGGEGQPGLARIPQVVQVPVGGGSRQFSVHTIRPSSPLVIPFQYYFHSDCEMRVLCIKLY